MNLLKIYSKIVQAGFLLVTALGAGPVLATSEAAYHEDVVQAFNIVYPELQLSVAKPASDEVILGELEILRDALMGQAYLDKELVHLACCAPSCGGDKDCR